ncbi:hypothetical protein HanIR_Chr10g0492111 [Helianthus annuus]|nr:hypothetical protein HanIR_Chr10g0492111 [Helianthus annuus]
MLKPLVLDLVSSESELSLNEVAIFIELEVSLLKVVPPSMQQHTLALVEKSS